MGVRLTTAALRLPTCYVGPQADQHNKLYMDNSSIVKSIIINTCGQLVWTLEVGKTHENVSI